MNELKVKKLTRLINEAKKLKNARQKFKAHLKENPNIDKYHFAFNQDTRFVACTPLPVFLSSDTGEHGSSNCYTYLNLDEDLYKEYLKKALNKHIDIILNTMSDMMLEDAKQGKEKAIAFYEKQKELLNSID